MLRYLDFVSGAEQERRVLGEALRFVVEPGRFIISALDHPYHHPIALPSFPDGQSHRQTLQLPTLVTENRTLFGMSLTGFAFGHL